MYIHQDNILTDLPDTLERNDILRTVTKESAQLPRFRNHQRFDTSVTFIYNQITQSHLPIILPLSHKYFLFIVYANQKNMFSLKKLQKMIYWNRKNPAADAGYPHTCRCPACNLGNNV